MTLEDSLSLVEFHSVLVCFYSNASAKQIIIFHPTYLFSRSKKQIMRNPLTAVAPLRYPPSVKKIGYSFSAFYFWSANFSASFVLLDTWAPKNIKHYSFIKYHSNLVNKQLISTSVAGEKILMFLCRSKITLVVNNWSLQWPLFCYRVQNFVILPEWVNKIWIQENK